MPNFVESIQARRIRVELSIIEKKSEGKKRRRRKEEQKRQGSVKFSHAIFAPVRNFRTVRKLALQFLSHLTFDSSFDPLFAIFPKIPLM